MVNNIYRVSNAKASLHSQEKHKLIIILHYIILVYYIILTKLLTDIAVQKYA